MLKFKVRTGDFVKVISGSDKGNSGKIVSVDRKKSRIVVEGINIRTLHKKRSKDSEGGIIKSEGSIHISNVSHLDPEDNKATRIGYKFDDNGKKVRFAKKSGKVIN